ncbi:MULTISPECIES: O-antigen ligase [unclassified Meiothermus]|uniref:O-antigen ligase family protein n=1 Tax=unclassified Meiothermus TaxID=370471 RepID=UPI000D7C3C24|nr:MULTISPECIES: O-antigen ligase family protein [unclassified Meiothermus]PZA06812.1 O-antigen polymerase [Meiothermus sp. Pnk-1]RYM33092.1 O-antigen ligase family protein [Meiothermus sp. PNK-Is4]
MRGLRAVLWSAPWLLLPLEPAWAGGVLALVGVWSLVRGGRVWLWGPLLLFALLGSLGQLLSPKELFSLPQPAFLGTPPAGLPPNQILPFELGGLHGWNPKDGPGGRAERVEGGFWRLPRRNPATGREQAEFLMDRWYPLKPGQTYTQSFYLRHDGKEARFQITFFTERGHHPVPTQVEPVAPGVWRVWGSYIAQEGDRSVRAIDLLNGGGDWTYIEIGFAQLEEGAAPTPYRPGVMDQPSLWQRVSWWIGTALLSGLVLQGSLFLLQRAKAAWVAAALAAGLALHLGYGVVQLSHLEGAARVSGLSSQPNFFGHGAVMAAALAWLVGGSRVGGLTLVLAAGAVWVSGSRAAFWAWGLLLGAWWWGLGRWRWAVLIPLMLLGAALSDHPEWLGRLQDAAKIDSSAESRLQFWHIAWRAFREHPLGGVGFGNFPLYYQIHLPPGAIETYVPHAHNLLLQLLAEGGLLGLAGFGVLWGGVALLLIRLRAWKGLALLGVALLLNLFDYTFFNAAVYYPLWVGLAWTILQAARDGRLVMPARRDQNHPDTLTG